MTKTWQCTQCGQKVSKGLSDALGEGEPAECSTCGSTAFSELRVTGSVHEVVDGSGETVSNQLTRRRAMEVLGGGALVAGGTYWFFGRPTVAETTSVVIRNQQFRPRNIEVEVGANVIWSNEEESGEGEPITYFLRSATDSWEFEAQVEEGDATAHTFEQSGVYGLYAEGLGGPDLSGMAMKIGVGTSIDDPLGGWF